MNLVIWHAVKINQSTFQISFKDYFLKEIISIETITCVWLDCWLSVSVYH